MARRLYPEPRPGVDPEGQLVKVASFWLAHRVTRIVRASDEMVSDERDSLADVK